MTKEKLYFTEDDDPVDIRYDNVFKAVFTKNTPESQGALSKLVSALIGRELSIVAITANEPAPGNLRDRQIRFDINCRAENGELVNVEMGLNPARFEPVRLEFHAGKLFTGQEIRGKDNAGTIQTGQGGGKAAEGHDRPGTLGGVFPVFAGQSETGYNKRDTGIGGGHSHGERSINNHHQGRKGTGMVNEQGKVRT
jgi:hypothetical protein